MADRPSIVGTTAVNTGSTTSAPQRPAVDPGQVDGAHQAPAGTSPEQYRQVVSQGNSTLDDIQQTRFPAGIGNANASITDPQAALRAAGAQYEAAWQSSPELTPVRNFVNGTVDHVAAQMMGQGLQADKTKLSADILQQYIAAAKAGQLHPANEGDAHVLDLLLHGGDKLDSVTKAAQGYQQAYQAVAPAPTGSAAPPMTPQQRLEAANNRFYETLQPLSKDQKQHMLGMANDIKNEGVPEADRAGEFVKRVGKWALETGRQTDDEALFNVVVAANDVGKAENAVTGVRVPGAAAAPPPATPTTEPTSANAATTAKPGSGAPAQPAATHGQPPAKVNPAPQATSSTSAAPPAAKPAVANQGATAQTAAPTSVTDPQAALRAAGAQYEAAWQASPESAPVRNFVNGTVDHVAAQMMGQGIQADKTKLSADILQQYIAAAKAGQLQPANADDAHVVDLLQHGGDKLDSVTKAAQGYQQAYQAAAPAPTAPSAPPMAPQQRLEAANKRFYDSLQPLDKSQKEHITGIANEIKNSGLPEGERAGEFAKRVGAWAAETGSKTDDEALFNVAVAASDVRKAENAVTGVRPPGAATTAAEPAAQPAPTSASGPAAKPGSTAPAQTATNVQPQAKPASTTAQPQAKPASTTAQPQAKPASTTAQPQAKVTTASQDTPTSTGEPAPTATRTTVAQPPSKPVQTSTVPPAVKPAGANPPAPGNPQTPNPQTPNTQTPNTQTPNTQTPNTQTPNSQTPNQGGNPPPANETPPPSTETPLPSETAEVSTTMGTLGKVVTKGGGVLAVAGGGLQAGHGVYELGHGKKFEGTVDTLGGTGNLVGGVGVLAGGTAATVMAPFAFGGAALLDGGRDIRDGIKKGNHQKIEVGGAKTVGGGLMVAAGVCAATGVGAPVAVGLAVAGGVVYAGAAIYDSRHAIEHFVASSWDSLTK